ncbi:MAG: IPT/TIG domain-containing protein [Anaerolineae bacterium]|jgi:hypothetical protein
MGKRIASAIAAFIVTLLLLANGVAARPSSIALTSIEPDTMISGQGGTLSIYGADFTTATVARLVGHGLLETTFVDGTKLKAVVPSGIPPGTYDVQVSEETLAATLPSALTIVAATPTPRPTSAPTPKPTAVPGQPNLSILNYSVEPVRVVAGSEFVATVEVYNNGSRAGENTTVTFPGGTFTPVGDTGHLLWQLHINHTSTVTQRMRAPSSLSSGIYDLQVDLSANDWEGNHYEFPRSIPVEVVGLGGRPKLVVEEAETEPTTLGPGDVFTLTLRLVNRGNRTATDALVGVASPDLAVPAGGSNVLAGKLVRPNQKVTATLPLVLAEVTKAGHRALSVALEYGDYGGGSYSDQQDVGLDVSTTLSERPQVIIERYRSTPDSLAPGDTFTLTLVLSNVGGGDAERLVVTLGGETDGGLGPFAPVGSSNVKFVSGLPAGATIDVAQRLVVDGSAESGSYSLPVQLALDDPRDTRHTDSQLISLMVRRRPHLQIGFYRTVGKPTVGEPFAIPVEVANIGRTTVNISTLELSSEELEIQDGSLYLGPLDGGTAGSLEATGIARQGGPADVVVSVHYLDDFEELQVVTKTLAVEVEQPLTPTLEPESRPNERNIGLLRTVWRFLRALLGLGS